MARGRGMAMFAGLVAVGVGLAGCGGSADGPAGVPQSGASRTTAAGARADTQPVQITDACSLVSVAEAAAATGLAGLSKKQSNGYFCSYQGGNGAVDISVTPAPYAQSSVSADKAKLEHPATDLSGVGDAAFVSLEQPGIGFGEMWARGLTFEIRVKSPANDPVTAAGALLKVALSHVPAS